MNEVSRPHHQNVVAMTQVLEQAIARLKTLSTNEQGAIALMMERLKTIGAGMKPSSRSLDVLANLAASAMAEYHAGKTQALIQRHCEVSSSPAANNLCFTTNQLFSVRCA